MKGKIFSRPVFVVLILALVATLLPACGADAPVQTAGHLPYLALETSADANGGVVQGVLNKETGDRGVVISSMNSTSGTIDVWWASRREMPDRKEFGVPENQLKTDDMAGITTDAVLARYSIPETEDSRTWQKVAGGVVLGIGLAVVADWGIGKLAGSLGGKTIVKEAAEEVTEEGLERIARMNADEFGEFLTRHGLSAGDNLTDDAIEELIQAGRITDDEAKLFREGALKTDDLLETGARAGGAIVPISKTGSSPLRVVYEEGIQTSFYHLDDVGKLRPGIGFLDAYAPTIVVQNGETLLHFKVGPLELTRFSRSGGSTVLGGEIHTMFFPLGQGDELAKWAIRQADQADRGLSLLPTISHLAVDGVGTIPVAPIGQTIVKVPVESVIRPATNAGTFLPLTQ